MSAFKPYQIYEDSGTLTLKLAKFNILVSVFAFRILPLFIVLAIVGLVSYNPEPFPATIYLGLLCILVVAIFMLLVKINADILLTSQKIEIKSIKFFRTISVEYLRSDISHRSLDIYTGGRSSGAYYKIVKNNKSKIALFNLPILFRFDPNNFRQVNSKLESTTGLKIVGNLQKLN